MNNHVIILAELQKYQLLHQMLWDKQSSLDDIIYQTISVTSSGDATSTESYTALKLETLRDLYIQQHPDQVNLRRLFSLPCGTLQLIVREAYTAMDDILDGYTQHRTTRRRLTSSEESAGAATALNRALPKSGVIVTGNPGIG